MSTVPLFVNGYFLQRAQGLAIGYSPEMHCYAPFLRNGTQAVYFSGTLFPGSAAGEGHIGDRLGLASVREVEHVPGEWLSFVKQYTDETEVVLYRMSWKPDIGCFHGSWTIFSSLPAPQDRPDAPGEARGEARCLVTPWNPNVAFNALG